MPNNHRMLALCAVLLIIPSLMLGQSTNATITGQVADPTKAVLPQATVRAINNNTNVRYEGTTNQSGAYLIRSIPPGDYRVEVEKQGFKTIIKPDIILHVQDAIELNFEMAVGSTRETVTVEGGAPLVNTQDAAVSTVVDRNFAENLPMNGRSFQTLVQLTPGVVTVPSNSGDAGQFSVNGQRSASNYWTVDGVSANVGVTAISSPGNGMAGALGAFSAQGGTNSLVSVDALQEFRIQTSTYAPEFGRTPGAQISIVTRSGTNQFHGTAFDFLRNDVLDGNDWFNGFNNNPPLPKAKDRQNDFGGTLSGPIFKNRTFFFFSYEGLRLRLPQTATTSVPDVQARQNASSALKPFLNAYPLPNGADNLATGVAQFSASFSNTSTLDAYSIRVDHKLTDRLLLFGRYNYSPSEITARGGSFSLSTVSPARIKVHTATVGATWTFVPSVVNDLRYNYSRTTSASSFVLDSFGGAAPLSALSLPSPFTPANAALQFQILSLSGSSIVEGRNLGSLQRQNNWVDSLSVTKGAHNIKLGFDYRRLSPVYDPVLYLQLDRFTSVTAAGAGTLQLDSVTQRVRAGLIFNNLGAFVQDTWRASTRLTLTYGLRWDVDFAPSSDQGPNLVAVTGFDLKNLSNLALAPSGAPPFTTTYGNIGPRFGVAYQMNRDQNRQTVLRGGFGVFFDLATPEAGHLFTTTYPFAASKVNIGGTFPLDDTRAAPPPISLTDLRTGLLAAFDPNLKLPYTLQWSAALEQALGSQHSVSITYIGSVGRRLIQTAVAFAPNSNFTNAAQLVSNASTSDYDALQVQYQNRPWHGLQALASYGWAHSIDTASAGSFGSVSNGLVEAIGANANRGASDFDVRHAFSAGMTYSIPKISSGRTMRWVFGNWALENVIQAHTALPVNLFDGRFFSLFSTQTQIRPDVVPGVPFYVFGSQFPGGKSLNRAAFTDPPVSSGSPTRQGNLGRNALRAFGAAQWDLAVHRDFPITESVRLQFRAETFNVLNHPNFGPPVADLNNATQFGRSTQMLSQSLNGRNAAGGAFQPLYQIGGPRSMQLALKLSF